MSGDPPRLRRESHVHSSSVHREPRELGSFEEPPFFRREAPEGRLPDGFRVLDRPSHETDERLRRRREPVRSLVRCEPIARILDPAPTDYVSIDHPWLADAPP